jgi:tetratricopeptide (TPR) repeat protein
MYYLRIILISTLTCAALNTSIAQTTPQATDSPQLIESRELTSKVVKLYGERKYDEALPLAKRALELGDAALGSTHAGLIPILINLGDLYVATLDFDDAKKSFERALSIGENTFGVDNLRLTRALDELGYLASNKGEYRKAVDLFSRSLAIKEKFLEPGNIEIPRAAVSLAEIYRRNNDYAKADPLYQQAIRIYEESGQKDDRELVQALTKYLIVLSAENKKDEAASVEARLAKLSAESGVVEGGVLEGGVLNGNAVKFVRPTYPPSAPRSPLVIVQVRVLIDETGKVIKAEATGRLHPALRAAVEDAARHSVFAPTFRAGAPVKVSGTIIYQFRNQ